MKRLITTTFIALAASCAFAQSRAQDVPFNGAIYDASGMPVKGAKVWVKDSRRYAKSDKQGHFGLTNVMPTDTLHLRYKGTKYDIAVEGKKSIRIKLADQVQYNEDEELVNLGYGFVKKRECTTSRAGISGEELIRTGQTNILAALQGRVAGLNITASGAPGNRAQVTMRGINSINLDCTPLFVIDDIVVSTLDMVNLYDVDYVEVMREASIYGSRGANGAIIVHTKTHNSKK